MPSLKYRALRRTYQALKGAGVHRVARRASARNDRGDPLDPDTALLLWLSKAEPPPDYATRTVADARAEMQAHTELVQGPAHALRHTRDLEAAGLPARLYVPLEGPPDRLLVYFHGGGWVVGDLDSHDRLCQHLAARGRQRVLSVSYRLAPEHPFPCAVDDALAAFRWAREHARELGTTADHIAVGGDSAGGNLAAVTCLQLRDAGEPQPVFQLLIYPATDFRRLTPAHLLLGDDYLLTRHTLDWYEARYAPSIQDPRCSPLLHPDHRGLAPAIIANAGFDPLRDDGEWYGRALRKAGVPVTVHDHRGLIHGFASMGGLIPAAARAVDALADACTRVSG